MGIGLFAAGLSAFFAASKDLVSKKLAVRLDGHASTFASFAFAIPYYVLLLAILLSLRVHESIEFTSSFLLLLFLRASTDTVAESMKMHSLNYGDISLMASFLSLSPIFLLILSPLITGDEITWHGIIAVFFVVAGSLVLVYKPPSGGWALQKKGILMAITASLFFALNNCFDRLALNVKPPADASFGIKLFKPAVAGFSMTLLSACFVAPLMFRGRDRWSSLGHHQTGLWTRGFFEIAFMVSKLFSLQYLPPTDVTVIQRFALFLSIIGGRILFREGDFGRRMIAAFLILCGFLIELWKHWP